jgi:paired amphipathic helix protein Sin3a
VVGNAVRQLQHLVSDESCVQCYDLFVAESKNDGTGGNCGSAADRQIAEIVYQKKAEKLLTDENCIKIFLVLFSNAPEHVFFHSAFFEMI